MMPFSGAPKNKKKPLPSTESAAPKAEPKDESEDLEAVVSALSREDLMNLQDMINARLEVLDGEESVEGDAFVEDGEDEDDEAV